MFNIASVLLLLCLAGATNPAGSTIHPSRFLIAGVPTPLRVLLRFHHSATTEPDHCTKKIEAAGGTHVQVLQITRGPATLYAAELTQAAYDALRADSDVRNIEVDAVRKPVQQPQRQIQLSENMDDTQFLPYGIDMVRANKLDDRFASDVTVCIIDTGYDLGHPDLPGPSHVTSSPVKDTGDPYTDKVGHGTHVAGTIMALNNDHGVLGILPSDKVKLHVVKMFQDDEDFSQASSLIAALGKCVNDGNADVINLSLGGTDESQIEAHAFELVSEAGVLVVAAAGNDGSSSCIYPACYPTVLAVGAVDKDEEITSFSTHNDQVDLSAPGLDVTSTFPRDMGSKYATLSGTSMAAPHVTGSAALVWSHHKSCTNIEVRQALEKTARDKGTSGRDEYYGFGIVDTVAAKQYLEQHPCAGSTALVGQPHDPIGVCDRRQSTICLASQATCCRPLCGWSQQNRGYYNNYYCALDYSEGRLV